jgi:hypothetical protein
MGAETSIFLEKPCTAFLGTRRVATGSLLDVALVVQESQPSTGNPIYVFDDSTRSVIDLDLRGSRAEIVARLTERAREEPSATRQGRKSGAGASTQGPGRPKLGVVAREVTLLPRHWDWLAMQPGGASAALRRLVERACLGDSGETAQRQAQEAAFRFLSAVAGNFAGFEEAIRALFCGQLEQVRQGDRSLAEGCPCVRAKAGSATRETNGKPAKQRLAVL